MVTSIISNEGGVLLNGDSPMVCQMILLNWQKNWDGQLSLPLFRLAITLILATAELSASL